MQSSSGDIFNLYGSFIGISKKVEELITIVDKVADRSCTILITGESGVGKELVARSIHKRSARCKNPFITVDCTTISYELAESELFGHKKGAYTGAHKDTEGFFEIAKEGVIFLDEISELPLNIQSKLLRVLEYGTFRRVGSASEKKSFARVVAATNKSLDQLVLQRTFRKDLFYRLNVFTINVPPLRDRKEDIEILAQYFLRSELKESYRYFSEDAIELLKSYEWPGNVRELRNIVEMISILSDNKEIDAYDVASVMDKYLKENSSHEFYYKEDMNFEELEALHIKNLIRSIKNRGENVTITKLSKILGVSRGTVYNKLSKYSINIEEK